MSSLLLLLLPVVTSVAAILIARRAGPGHCGLADAGRVPAQSHQWGALYTPAISKLVLNSFHGGASYLLGASPLPAMGALLWVAWNGVVRPRLIPRGDIEQLAADLVARYRDRA